MRLTGYTGDYNGYASADGLGGVAGADDGHVTVISKSATLWSKPSTGSKKVASMNHQDVALCLYDGGYEPVMQNNFYHVDYKGKTGWVNAAYVVRNKLEIVLMESNVPAYVAPDRNAKKVGSLSKMTRYRVIGFYDDYYIVSFRGAACAYIPMGCRHYDTTFEAAERTSSYGKGTVAYSTKLRTGPGESYPEIKALKEGETVVCLDKIEGWYVLWYSGQKYGRPNSCVCGCGCGEYEPVKRRTRLAMDMKRQSKTERFSKENEFLSEIGCFPRAFLLQYGAQHVQALSL